MAETSPAPARPRRHGPLSDLVLLARLVALNFQGAMEYRVSFLLSVTFMALNNAVYLAFWWIFFARFREVRGWDLDAVLILFSICATAFGMAHMVFGNLSRLSHAIAEGHLDLVLGQPRDPLLKLLAARTSTSSLGDLGFGLLLFALFGSREPLHMAFFVVVCTLSAVVLVSFGVIVHSLAFWLGGSEGISRTLSEALLMFSMYPDALFSGMVKVLLFTVVPAGFLSHIPMWLLADFDPLLFLGYAAFAGALALTARAVFARGLRRYESGSQMVANV